ncbi:hypothetical protein [Actinokineospora pegani]|uniref:hypothetical protein n=1 Tax=Actinokineospora pegani TaxID=2654637 RepID=UPI0012E9EC7F|nr:hypothetical protein [Actinokineospora pegani]
MSERIQHPRPHDDDPRDPEYTGHNEDRDELVVEPDPDPQDAVAEERPPAEG